MVEIGTSAASFDETGEGQRASCDTLGLCAANVNIGAESMLRAGLFRLPSREYIDISMYAHLGLSGPMNGPAFQKYGALFSGCAYCVLRVLVITVALKIFQKAMPKRNKTGDTSSRC